MQRNIRTSDDLQKITAVSHIARVIFKTRILRFSVPVPYDVLVVTQSYFESQQTVKNLRWQVIYCGVNLINSVDVTMHERHTFFFLCMSLKLHCT